VDPSSGKVALTLRAPCADEDVAIPSYLTETYWWAYVHPRAVYLFERQWLVNVILWGNFARLRDLALHALGALTGGRTLQIACVYGDLTARLIAQLGSDSRLDVVDILPIQLQSLARKLPDPDAATAPRCSSRAAATIARSSSSCCTNSRRRFGAARCPRLRVVKPGGRIVIVDYHRPRTFHPLHLPMAAILRGLEPFALDLWRHDVARWLPPGSRWRQLPSARSSVACINSSRLPSDQRYRTGQRATRTRPDAAPAVEVTLAKGNSRLRLRRSILRLAGLPAPARAPGRHR
jgi:SAM-dependent methyltransferase